MSENNVGILAIEVYFPQTYVLQSDMEVANGVSKGKYTIGLGQEAMAFTGDQEDINSISLTVVQSLLEKYSISPNEIGRLEIGTESLVDKSKSTKTILMSLFASSGNTDVEGATVLNACYGGTAALLNALAWADSSAWDGRFAIVVAADIAVYAEGPARPTGGCGAVAMLVGRGGVAQVDLRSRASHSSDVWDFFKPKLDSEYPEVDGALSQTCYLRALDDCYTRFAAKNMGDLQVSAGGEGVAHFLFHSPYNKLVQKSFSRLLLLDCKRGLLKEGQGEGELAQWASRPLEDTYEDKELEAKLKALSAPLYLKKVAPSCKLSQLIGNTYTAAVYMNLADLISLHGPLLHGRNVVLFSYGSGALATMLRLSFSIPSSSSSTVGARFSLEKMQAALNIAVRLNERQRMTPNDLTIALNAREEFAHGEPVVGAKVPKFSSDSLAVGTFYLQSVDASYRRHYARKL
jgi:hydroxymethylglutaryl-CoA synthase